MRGRVLLNGDLPQGIWGGLWSPPEFPDEGAPRLVAGGTSRFGARPDAAALPTVRHAFTHFDLDIEPWVVELPARPGPVAEGDVALAAPGDDRSHRTARARGKIARGDQYMARMVQCVLLGREAEGLEQRALSG